MAKIKVLSADEIADGLFKLISSMQGDKGMRSQATKRNGQYYVFDGGTLKKTIDQLKRVRHKEDDKGVALFDNKNLDIREIINYVDSVFKAAEGKYASQHKERYNLLKKRKNEVKKISKVDKTGAKVYILLNYNQIGRLYSSKINPYIEGKMLELVGKDTKRGKRLKKAGVLKFALSGSQEKQAKMVRTIDGNQSVSNLGTQLGHGEFGKPVAALQAEAIGEWAVRNKNSMSTAQFQQIQDALITVESILDCKLQYTNIREGKLELGAELIVSNQLTIENSADAQALEQPIAMWLLTYLTQREVTGGYFAHWASPLVERKVLDQLIKGWRFKGVKTKKTFPKLNKLDTKADRKAKKGTMKTLVTMMTGWGGKSLLEKIHKEVKTKQYSKLGIKTGETGTPGKANRQMVAQIIGKSKLKLHKEVVERMTYPALQMQSGRFAASVDLLNLTQTARGLKALYKYDMEHYGTFEPGNKQGNRARDPNRLIEEAITRATHSTSGIIPTLFQRVG